MRQLIIDWYPLLEDFAASCLNRAARQACCPSVLEWHPHHRPATRTGLRVRDVSIGTNVSLEWFVMRHTWIEHGELLRLHGAAALKVRALRKYSSVCVRPRLGVTAAKRSGDPAPGESQASDPDRESPEVSVNDQSVTHSAMAKRKNAPVGIEFSAENAAIGLVYFTQGVLGLARLATTYFFKDVSYLTLLRASVILR